MKRQITWLSKPTINEIVYKGEDKAGTTRLNTGHAN